MPKCGARCEIYSRVCGYHRPVSNWNKGKRAEFDDRETFDLGKALQRHQDGEDMVVRARTGTAG